VNVEQEDRRFVRLKGDLRQLVTKLDEGSLRLVHHWVDSEIQQIQEQLRVVQNPSAFDPAIPVDNPIAMLGAVRRLLHELPEDRLLQLYGWIERRLVDYDPDQ
jgi:hypothetical protein